MKIFGLFVIAPFFTLLSLSKGMGFPHTDPAIRCKDHPAYQNSLNPVLVSSFTFPASSLEVESVAYLARYDKHVYAPVGDLSSNKYKGLDLFHTANKKKISVFAVHFQRPAKMYLFVDVPSSSFDSSKKASLPGWKDEGWAKLVNGQEKIVYGIHQKLERTMSKYVYVFSRTTAVLGKDLIHTAQTDFIRTNMRPITVPGTFNLWIAEIDGKPSKPVGSFRGTNIQPNTKCPDSLHNVWRVKDNNPNDADTRNQLFSSWHPQWDPCWWCAYDHEHGSSPQHLMGYIPKFTYTAFKNNRQNEADNGFKGIVLRSNNNKYLMYYSIHVTQSTLRRVKTRFHTINLAVVERRSKKLVMDIQHKGDFGFQSVRLKGGKTFRPIDKEEQAIADEQNSKGLPQNFRSINVLDLQNPNTAEFQIRNPIGIGQYEVWQTLPICAKVPNRRKLLEVTFKGPNNGIKSLAQPNVVTILGRKARGTNTFIKATGVNRALSADRIVIGTKYCPGGAKGYFYTDPDGKKLLNGPGRNAVRQFAKDGFEMTIDGRFDVVDRWTGMHTSGSRGSFVDHGYGLDPAKN